MGNKTILVIDDNEEIRSSCREFFEISGFPCLDAANGLEGLEAIQRIPAIGLVIVDLLMPVMSGIEFIRKCKNNPYYDYIPIYIMTAYADHERMGPQDTKLFRGVLDKPVAFSKLLEIAQIHCN